MRLPRFHYFEPGTLEGTLSLLEEHRDRCKVLAGGTDLLVAMKRRLQTPANVISLAGVPLLDGISENNGTLVIGPMTTLERIAGAPEIHEKVPGLARAAWEVGSPLLRTVATIGGNLCLDTRCRFYNQSRFWRTTKGPCCKTGGDRCHVTGRENTCYSSFSGDVAPMLIALGAAIKLVNRQGERILPLKDFYTGDGRRPNLFSDGSSGIMTSIQVPIPSRQAKSTYRKFRFRESIDFPVVGVAVTIEKSHNEAACQDIRIVLTGVGSRPVEALGARQQALGRILSPAVVATMAETAASEVHPVRTDTVTPYYKRNLARIMVAEAIEELGG